MDSHGPNGADSSALAQLISNLRDFLGIISTAARRLEPPSISYENTKMQLGRFKMWIDEFDTEKLPLTTILDGAKELTEGVVSLLTRLIACVVFEYGFLSDLPTRIRLLQSYVQFSRYEAIPNRQNHPDSVTQDACEASSAPAKSEDASVSDVTNVVDALYQLSVFIEWRINILTVLWDKEDPPAEEEQEESQLMDGHQASSEKLQCSMPVVKLETASDIEHLLGQIVHDRHLAAFYAEEDVHLIAQEAVAKLPQALQSLGLPHTSCTHLLTLNIYDHYIYIDDSTSMRQGSPRTRYDILKDAVRRLSVMSDILTTTKTHLFIRYINRNGDYDNLNAQDFSAILDSVKVGGGTKIGTNLRTKIVERLIENLRRGDLKRPVLVSIITDGEPWGEARDTMSQAIDQAKQAIKSSLYGNFAIMFHISRVGNDRYAFNFIKELNEGCDDALFANLESLDSIFDDPSRNPNAKLLEVAYKALEN